MNNIENAKSLGCKYLQPNSIVVYDLVDTLYNVMNELCGGACHIVTDENNIDDDSLKAVIKYCNEDGKDSKSALISRFICEAMLTLTEEQREFIFSIIESDYIGSNEERYGIRAALEYCRYGDSNNCDDRCPYKIALNRFHTNRLNIRGDE